MSQAQFPNRVQRGHRRTPRVLARETRRAKTQLEMFLNRSDVEVSPTMRALLKRAVTSPEGARVFGRGQWMTAHALMVRGFCRRVSCNSRWIEATEAGRAALAALESGEGGAR